MTNQCNTRSGFPAKSLIALAVGAAALALSTSVSAIAIAGNGIYDIAVQGSTGSGSIGSWTAATAAGHPVGTGKDILFSESGGTFVATTNFSSLRVYNSALGGVTDYTFGGRGGSVNLDGSFISEGASPLGTGRRTSWGVTAEGLGITQDVIVAGATFANSAIYHTVEISNSGTQAKMVGWRNLYDWQVDAPGTDDGPNNSVETTSGIVVAATTLEFSHTPAAGEFVRVSIDPPGGGATYEPLLAIGLDPGFIPSLPLSTPDEYAYVSWPNSFGTAFAYTVNPILNVTDDSAGLSWFGSTGTGTGGSALNILPGNSVRITQILFGVAAAEPPPGGVPAPGILMLLSIGLVGMVPALRRRQSQG